jgi:hypothetical protein
MMVFHDYMGEERYLGRRFVVWCEGVGVWNGVVGVVGMVSVDSVKVCEV